MAKIHPTAIVDKGAEIEEDVEIGPYCTVGPRVKLGKRNILRSHVIIEGDTQIGEDNDIFPFAVIGAIPQDLKYNGEPTKLVVGNRNKIRESVTLNLGTEQGGGISKIGDDNLLMAYFHLGHDSIVGNHNVLANGVGLAGHVIIDDYAILSGMVGVSQFVKVGSYTYVGGQSGLEKSVPPYCMAFGSRPCEVRGANIVGMRRKGFSAEKIQIINEAIKLWIRPEVQKEQCLLEIESQYGEHEEIQYFLKFVRGSETGVIK